MSITPDYLVIALETAQTVYALVRDGADEAIDRHILDRGFEPTEGIPGIGPKDGWRCYAKRLFTEEGAA